MSLNFLLPKVYGRFLNKKILSVDATETKATCDNCLRSRDKRFAYTYNENLKCCTFHPFFPNYAVGAILEEYNSSSVGFQKLLHKISEKEFTFPIGVMAPFEYQFKFLTKEEDEFGNRKDLLCPYFDKSLNKCSVWSYRGVVCTSFYCRSDYGQNGLKFWAVLSDYLSYVEMALAEECLVQLDFSPRDISNQLLYLNKREFEAGECDQRVIENSNYKKIWNHHESEVDFYKKCFAIVKKIDRNQFIEIIGKQGVELEQEVIDYANRR